MKVTIEVVTAYQDNVVNALDSVQMLYGKIHIELVSEYSQTVVYTFYFVNPKVLFSLGVFLKDIPVLVY